MAKKGKALKAKEYTKIKTLLDAGVNGSQISKLLERSSSMVYTIGQSKDFNDYKEMTRQRWMKHKSNGEAKKPTKAADFNDNNTIVSVLKAVEHQQQITNQNLERLQAILSRKKVLF